MAEISPEELLKKLRAGEFFRAYYIYGKDVATVENTSASILKKCLGKDWKNEVTRLDVSELDVSELIDMLQICPMFSECNAVFINDLNADDLTADDLKALTVAIADLPEYTMLIIDITGFDVKKGKKTLTAKNKKLADSISKTGVVCECVLKSIPDIVKSIASRTKKLGCTISRNSAEMLAEACGCDSLKIENELEKLCAYRIGAEIRREDIDTLVSAGIETDAFKLSRAIIYNDTPKAFDIINELIVKREEPVAVIAAVSMTFVDLYRARTAMTTDKRAADVVRDFKYAGRRFAVDNAFRDSRRISVEGIRECITLLRNADRSLKQTGAVSSLILEKTVTEMLIAVRRK